MKDLEISAPELVEFVERFVLTRPKEKRLEKHLIINTTTNVDDDEVGITHKQLERLSESLRYDANDIQTERFKLAPCVACEEICYFGYDDDDDWGARPFVCAACGEPFCGVDSHGTTLCVIDYEGGKPSCDECDVSPLCMRGGCSSSSPKYIDDRTISCECGNRYVPEHSVCPDEWLKGLVKCAAQGCGKNLCNQSGVGCCRTHYGSPDLTLSFECNICEKVWCSDHIPQGTRSCERCLCDNDRDDFCACPSCIQENKDTGEYFKLCKCEAKLACNICAKKMTNRFTDAYYTFAHSWDERRSEFRLICSECKP